MGSSKQTQDERVRKILAKNDMLYGARPTNVQTIHDAIKKCRGNRQAESDLTLQVAQWTTNLYKYFKEELDNIPLLSPDERKNLLGNVHRYNQRLFEWFNDGNGKDDLDIRKRASLISEHTSLVERLRDLQQSTPADAKEDMKTVKEIAEAFNRTPSCISQLCKDGLIKSEGSGRKRKVSLKSAASYFAKVTKKHKEADNKKDGYVNRIVKP